MEWDDAVGGRASFFLTRWAGERRAGDEAMFSLLLALIIIFSREEEGGGREEGKEEERERERLWPVPRVQLNKFYLKDSVVFWGGDFLWRGEGGSGAVKRLFLFDSSSDSSSSWQLTLAEIAPNKPHPAPTE